MIFESFKKRFFSRYQALNTIEISKSKLQANYRRLKKINQKISVAPVLKSNAYGHGIREVAQILDPLRPPFFCVDSIYEAYELFKAGVKTSILVFGYVDPDNLMMKKLPFTFVAYDLPSLRGILKYQPEADIHFFVDTGMHREGLNVEELDAVLSELESKEKKRITGVMSHLAKSENPNDWRTKAQVRNFRRALSLFKKYGIKPNWTHLANSDGLINQDKLKLGQYNNMARTGIALYENTLQLKTRITQVKKVEKGGKIGYDYTYTAKREIKTGTLPIGYNDGIDRRFSNKGIFYVGKTPCSVVGRVSMNITVIDVSRVSKARRGLEVSLISNNPEAKNSVTRLAKKIGVIPYEILVGLNPEIKRIIV